MSSRARWFTGFGVVLMLAACSESEPEPAEPPAAASEPAAEQPAAEQGADEAAPAEAEQPAEPAEGADPAAAAAIVERVGAPIFEGATLTSVSEEEGRQKAVYLTQEGYNAVKAYYDDQLKEPGWTNNGFGMGPFGGSSWQYTSAEGDLHVVVSDEDNGTEIRFSHPTE